MRFYKAAPPGLVQVNGVASFTTTKRHAMLWTGDEWNGWGGKVIYRADVMPAKILDARRVGSNRQVARRLGLEPIFDELVVVNDGGKDGSANVFYREIAEELTQRGYDWIIFDLFGDGSRNYEALHVAAEAISLTEVAK